MNSDSIPPPPPETKSEHPEIGNIIPPPDEKKMFVVEPSIDRLRKELHELHELPRSIEFKNLISNISKTKTNVEEEGERDTEEDDELIQSSNHLLNKIIEVMHKLNHLLIRIYRKKFPGLEEQIKDPLLYAKVCQRIGNNKNIDQLQFHDILRAKSVLVLRMTFSDTLMKLTSGVANVKNIKDPLSNSRQLTEEEMKLLEDTITSVLKFEEQKNEILNFVSSQMEFVAPNLSAIIGTTLAAQLVGIAGGFDALSNLDSSSIQMLGRSNERYQYLQGFSSASLKNRFSGIIATCDIVQMTPAEYQKRASKMVSNKCVLAIRCDRFGTSPDAETGKKLRQKIIQSMTKIQAPPPPVQDKPLPVPDSYKQKTKRGGRNARRLKRLYGMTEVRSKMNRMAFGEKQVEDFDTGESFGLLGAQTGANPLKLRPKTKIKIKKQLKKGGVHTQGTPYYGGGDMMNSGLASSLVFTPIQGISLTNPDFAKKKKRKRNKFLDDLEFKRPQKRAKKK